MQLKFDPENPNYKHITNTKDGDVALEELVKKRLSG